MLNLDSILLDLLSSLIKHYHAERAVVVPIHQLTIIILVRLQATVHAHARLGPQFRKRSVLLLGQQLVSTSPTALRLGGRLALQTTGPGTSLCDGRLLGVGGDLADVVQLRGGVRLAAAEEAAGGGAGVCTPR